MILYIAGAGHSGSSLLDVILNNHPDIVGTGELHRLSLNPDTRKCSCGEVINQCAVWRKRIERICEIKSLSLDGWENDFPITHLRDGSWGNKINDMAYWLGVDALIKGVSGVNAFSKGLKESLLNTGIFHDKIIDQEEV